MVIWVLLCFFSSRRLHTRWNCDWSSDVCSSDLPADLDDLAVFLRGLPANEPVHWVGLGSNLLVRDGGLRGTVILTSGALNGLSPLSESLVRAEAGVPSAKVARFSTDLGFTGAGDTGRSGEDT